MIFFLHFGASKAWQCNMLLDHKSLASNTYDDFDFFSE